MRLERRFSHWNVPILRESETLYSWCAMWHAINSGCSSVASSIAMFGSATAARLHDFPSHLNTLLQRFGGALPDGRSLALRHTLVGYFLPLQTEQASEAVLSALNAGALPFIKMQLGITASRVGAHHPLKSCAECIRCDQQNIGVAYWRVEHQWPSAMVCLTHQRALTIVWDPTTPVHRRKWLMPGDWETATPIEVPVLSDNQLSRLLQLAQFSRSLAASEPAAFQPSRLAATYQAQLRMLGLASVRGNLRLKRLLDVARRRYSGIESVPGFETLQSIGPDWPGLVGSLSRRAPRPGHPLKHLLMIAMLFDSWEDFLATYAGTEELAQQHVSALLTSRFPSLDGQLHELITQERCSMRQAAARLHVCTTTATQIAKRLGIPFTPRPKHIRTDCLRHIRRLLLRGTPVKEIAAQTSVSVVSVNRILAADEQLGEARRVRLFLTARKNARQTFIAWMGSFPGLQINELRRIPGNPYTWLYRHDRRWLQENIPSLWSGTRSFGAPSKLASENGVEAVAT